MKCAIFIILLLPPAAYAQYQPSGIEIEDKRAQIQLNSALQGLTNDIRRKDLTAGGIIKGTITFNNAGIIFSTTTGSYGITFQDKTTLTTRPITSTSSLTANLDAINAFISTASAWYIDPHSAALSTAAYTPISNTFTSSNTFRQAITAPHYRILDNIVLSTTGGDNSLALGALAGANSTGQYNTYLGNNAGLYQSTGTSNTLLGFNAGRGGGINLGYYNNVVVGAMSGDTLNYGSDNILIGYNVEPPTANTNNYLSIGNLIKGDMATSSVSIMGSLWANNIYASNIISSTAGFAILNATQTFTGTNTWTGTQNFQTITSTSVCLGGVCNQAWSSITTDLTGVAYSTGVIPSTATGAYPLQAQYSTNAQNINLTDNNIAATSVYPSWVGGDGYTSLNRSSTKLSFIPNTGILSATGFSGSGANLTGVIISTADIMSQLGAHEAALSTAAFVNANNSFTGTNQFNSGSHTIGSSLTVRGAIYSTSSLTALSIVGHGSLTIDNTFDVGGAGNTPAPPPGGANPSMWVRGDYNGQGLYVDTWGYFGSTMTVGDYADFRGTATVQGSAFSVGGSTLVVSNGMVQIGVQNSLNPNGLFSISTNSTAMPSIYVSSQNGFVGIGTNHPRNALDVRPRINVFGSGVQGLISANTYQNSSAGSIMQLISGRGTVDSPSVSLQNDVIGYLWGYGRSDAANSVRTAAAVQFEIDGEPDTAGDTTDMPGRLTFLTSPDGTSTLTERMRIDSAGNVGISQTSPKTKLHVTGQMYQDGAGTKMIFTSPDASCSACGPDDSDVWACASVACP